MSTFEQNKKYGHVGNEKLKPLAIAGDAAAVAVLADRGNVLTEEGRLRKETRQEYTDSRGVERVDSVVVEDGRVVERNGEKVG